MGAGTWGPGENERGFVANERNDWDNEPYSIVREALENAGFSKIDGLPEFYTSLVEVEVGGWENEAFVRIKPPEEGYYSDDPVDTLREIGSLPVALKEAVEAAMQATERYLANALTMTGFECRFKAGPHSYSAPHILDEGFEWDAAAAQLKAIETVPELKDQIARAGMDPLSEDRSHLLRCIAEEKCNAEERPQKPPRAFQYLMADFQQFLDERLNTHQTSMVALLPVLWDEQIRFLPLGFNSPIQNLSKEAMLVTLTQDDPVLEGYARDAAAEFSGQAGYDPKKPVILGDQWRGILQQHVVSPSVMNFNHPNAVYAIIPTEKETKQHWGDLENPLLPSLDEQDCTWIALNNPNVLSYEQRRDLEAKGRVFIEGLTYETELPLDVVMDSPAPVQAIDDVVTTIARDELGL